MVHTVKNTTILPHGYLDLLSQMEAHRLLTASQGKIHELFRNCSLAVLNCGDDLDDSRKLYERYPDFDIAVIRENGGIALELQNAPASAFVGDKVIQGIREHLFAVLRDIVFAEDTLYLNPALNLTTSRGITNAVYHLLRNAGVLNPNLESGLIVCWGGHSISREEYDYTKEVGYQLGLRSLNICTGCGAGAMKGPMKGATIGHFKQRFTEGQYLGITEPGIIASESPNPIVNDLVIMPDIEKRLETFVRLGHGVVVFPGGVGTAEEILYLLSILLDPANQDIPFPFVLSGPSSARNYFAEIDQFIGLTLGEEARSKYDIIIDDPERVAQVMERGVQKVSEYRMQSDDTMFFNWSLNIDYDSQIPFEPTHENMLTLDLSLDRPARELAVDLRRAFSGIVAGNVKPAGIQAIEDHGLVQLRGQSEIMDSLDSMLKGFISQNRMKIPSDQEYLPCYSIVQDEALAELKN
ncbi:nucleotide 5'-monophosphate nucleosidase PpnN [Desulfosediminicola sp.]|uniref:nucleotide 5'-monophosphate nucleosidase PpnN n=1 Tax=Desulfosediminicola sp. TaxID=2886825 RepID=UPI003AF2A4AE